MGYWARCYGLSSPCINGVRVWLDSFSLRVGLRQVCPLSLILFITFMDRFSRCSQGKEGFQFDGVRISSLLFVDDVVLLAPSGFHWSGLQSSVKRQA